jgi:hypothetical protein
MNLDKRAAAMSENTAWAIVMCFAILVFAGCEVIQGNQRIEKQRIDFEAQKYCYENGGTARWYGSCVLEKKKVP